MDKTSTLPITVQEQMIAVATDMAKVAHPLHPYLGSDEDMRIAIQTLSDMIQDLTDRVTALEKNGIIINNLN